MNLTDAARKDIDAMPPELRALLEAELAAGNEIVEVGHGFPAPPVGAYVKLSRPLFTPASAWDKSISYYDRKGSSYSGEITNAKRFFFLLEPPHPPEPYPDMDAIREAHNRASGFQPVPFPVTAESSVARSPTDPSPIARFERSMVIDYDKWHDGIGYDLDILREMSPAELKATEAFLLRRGLNDWRDVEALARFDSPAVTAAMRAAMNSSNHEVRNAVTRCVPELIGDSTRLASLIRGLEEADIYGGLGQTLGQVEDFHPPAIMEKLFEGALDRDGGVAVHLAAMLFYLHGQASQPFDWNHRPFFLRFNTTNRAERETVFRELCAKVKVDPEPYLNRRKGKPKPRTESEIAGDYTVEVDRRGETLTYREPHRSAAVICTFGARPIIAASTLSGWSYPRKKGTLQMTPQEKSNVLERIIEYCRKHHRMGNVTAEA